MIEIRRRFKIILIISAFLAVLGCVFFMGAQSGVGVRAADTDEKTEADIVTPALEESTAAAEEEKDESFAEKIANKLSGLPDELICFVVSMIPVIELRGGLIIASIKDVPLWRAIGVCIAGNLVPIPFILLLITPIFIWLKKTKFFKPIVEKLEKKSMSKSEKIKKYEFIGLMLFVGFPLPGTGAWTGSLIAALLEIKLKKAFPAICLGLVMATIIMCFISYGIPWLVSNVF